MKSSDAHLKFAFITGRHQVRPGKRVFRPQSAHRPLHAPEYASLCGITEEELLDGFRPEIDALAQKEDISYHKCVERIRLWYNGYRFHPEGPAVYNPFSTLNLFNFNEFQDFWFQTGTPTFLVELLKKTDTDLREIDGIELPARAFADYRADPDRPVPVIYQSGYLTIKSYDPSLRFYTLGYPNAEVKNGFFGLSPARLHRPKRDKGGFHIGMFSKELGRRCWRLHGAAEVFFRIDSLRPKRPNRAALPRGVLLSIQTVRAVHRQRGKVAKDEATRWSATA